MNTTSMTTLVSLASVLGACAQSASEPTKFLGPTTTALKNCSDPKGNVVGVIRIWLPNSLNLAKPPLNNVRVETKPQPDEEKIDDPALMTDNPSNNPYNGKPRIQPFHIYLKNYIKDFGSKGRVAVRIINPSTSDYTFYDSNPNDMSENAIHGVGSGDGLRSESLCGNKTILVKAKRTVARFFIKLEEMSVDKERSFNIGLVPKAADETWIFIDPKVRNDG